jgi:hypothetical protein
VSWEDTALSSRPDERTAGESEIEVSPSTSVPNDLSASGDSSEDGAPTRFEPYVRVTRFFVETMGGDIWGDEEVGGAVLGESFRRSHWKCSALSVRYTLWNTLGEASGCLPIVDGHSRMSQPRDSFHVIASMPALNSPVASSFGSEDQKICDKNPFYDPLCIILKF